MANLRLWISNVWIVFIASLLLLVLVSSPVFARVKFSAETPAQGAIIHDLLPTISVHVEATGDSEFLDGPGYGVISITGCPRIDYDNPGLTISNITRNSLRQIKSMTLSFDVGSACTLPTFSHANPETVKVTFDIGGGTNNLFCFCHVGGTDTWNFQIMPQSGPGPMVITGTDPSSGSPGTVVTVHCHFCQQGSTLKAGSEITFDGTAVNTTFLSDTQPQFIVPADASCGPHKVQAIIPAFFTHLKEMSNVVTFTVTTPCSGGSGPGPNPGNQPPHANFTFTPANTAVGQMVQFTDQSSDPDGVSDIVSWNWDLGDGMTSTTQNHQHTYHSAATFTVRLIVTDHAGQTGTAIKSVTVTATPSSGSSLKSFDKNNNNKLDDTEFFAAVDAWIAGQISDIIFFKLVDLWISQGPITAASLRQLPPLSLDGVTLALSSAHDILFDAHGQGIRSMSVEVYRLDGKRVFRQEQTGNRFLWHLNEDNGLLVANGVYLYRVTAYGSNGGIMEDSVQRLLILR